MSTPDISTWAKTKDALLVGAVITIVGLLVATFSKVASIEVALATYSANVNAIERRLEKVEGQVQEHVRDHTTRDRR